MMVGNLNGNFVREHGEREEAGAERQVLTDCKWGENKNLKFNKLQNGAERPKTHLNSDNQINPEQAN